MFLFCLVFAMFCARLFICALWSPAGKGLTSWLSFVVSSVSLSLSHWYPGSGVVLDCIDSWSLHHYLLFFFDVLWLIVFCGPPSQYHGVGLQCVILVFPDHTHLLLWRHICLMMLPKPSVFQYWSMYRRDGDMQNNYLIMSNKRWFSPIYV